MRRRKVVPLISHICNAVGMGFANDEGSCSEPGLGMRVAVGLDTMVGWASEVTPKLG